MRPGRISPIFRQFFSSGLTARSNKDSHSNSGNPYDGNGERRQPASEEEAISTAELLNDQDEFKQQGLKASPTVIDGKHCILVIDKDSNILRTIQTTEIKQLFFNLSTGTSAPRIGKILDKRI